MLKKVVSISVVLLALFAPMTAHAIVRPVHVSSCQDCLITGIWVIFSQCISDPGSGKSGCYTLQQTPGCGFQFNYCVDVFGSIAPPPVDHIDTYGDLESAETDQLVLMLLN